VNVSSIMGSLGGRGAVPYTMSKHAVLGLTRTDAVSYATKGIRVNSVSPG
jgi:NAD(P)-dependent dehydrogenase (short-subunit alcohol dehydrogenase family)